MTPSPQLEQHGRFLVVRDDLLPGGTKQRFLPQLLDGNAEVVYAGPAWGGAAVGIAFLAQQMGLKATLFYSARAVLSPRQRLVRSYGARLELVRPGYLSVVKARAREYCQRTGAQLIEWGVPQAEATITAAAREVAAQVSVSEVWCAAGSGTLLRALARAFAPVPIIGVQVGHELTDRERVGCRIVKHPLPFEKKVAGEVPFPSCRHYDAKAWLQAQYLAKGMPLFWNVMRDH